MNGASCTSVCGAANLHDLTLQKKVFETKSAWNLSTTVICVHMVEKKKIFHTCVAVSKFFSLPTPGKIDALNVGLAIECTTSLYALLMPHGRPRTKTSSLATKTRVGTKFEQSYFAHFWPYATPGNFESNCFFPSTRKISCANAPIRAPRCFMGSSA